MALAREPSVCAHVARGVPPIHYCNSSAIRPRQSLVSLRRHAAAIVWLLIIAWSLAVVHVTTVTHGLSTSGQRLDLPTGDTRDSVVPEHSWAAVRTADHLGDHSCVVDALFTDPVLTGGAVTAVPHVPHARAIVARTHPLWLTRDVLAWAPKASPPQVGRFDIAVLSSLSRPWSSRVFSSDSLLCPVDGVCARGVRG